MMIFEGTYTSHHHSLHSRTWTLSIDHTKQLILRWGYPWVRGTTGSLEDDKHPRHSGGIEWSLLSQAILLVQVYIVQIQNLFRNRIGWDECWSDNDLVMCIVFGLSLLSARLVLILIEKLPQIIVKKIGYGRIQLNFLVLWYGQWIVSLFGTYFLSFWFCNSIFIIAFSMVLIIP